MTYAVSDIKVARHFYEDVLGLKAAESGSSMTWVTGKVPSAKLIGEDKKARPFDRA